jgi:hypothetical protein
MLTGHPLLFTRLKKKKADALEASAFFGLMQAWRESLCNNRSDREAAENHKRTKVKN